MSELEQLRQQLRERGYLTHGIERWFALDPWSSRTFWLELFVVAAKAAVLIAPFAAVPAVAIMLFRNHPLSVADTLMLTLMYAVAAVLAALALVIVVALLLKLRPATAVDTPRALLAISLACATLLAGPLIAWWFGFALDPSMPELMTGVLLLAILLVSSATVISAALLSFSIYEVKRIPTAVRRSRVAPLTIAASVLVAALFIPAVNTHGSAQQERPAAPSQIMISHVYRPVVFVAADGLTVEIVEGRRDLAQLLPYRARVPSSTGSSPPERWATVGTGVGTALHGVRAVEGVRLAGGRRLLQSLSRHDLVVYRLAPRFGAAVRQPLPPAVRRRQYVWESFAARGRVVTAINWWTTDHRPTATMLSIAQERIFTMAAAAGEPLARALGVDGHASQELLRGLSSRRVDFATVYLPALDIILNRLGLDGSARTRGSAQALDNIVRTVESARRASYEVLLIGLPGERQTGTGIALSSFPLRSLTASPYDVAPTLCTLSGFPPSGEMPGRSLAGVELPRISTYGGRDTLAPATRVDEEYYENLKSLGYIR